MVGFENVKIFLKIFSAFLTGNRGFDPTTLITVICNTYSETQCIFDLHSRVVSFFYSCFGHCCPLEKWNCKSYSLLQKAKVRPERQEVGSSGSKGFASIICNAL